MGAGKGHVSGAAEGGAAGEAGNRPEKGRGLAVGATLSRCVVWRKFSARPSSCCVGTTFWGMS